MQRLDLEIEMIEVAKLEEQGEDQEYLPNEEATAAIRNTERYLPYHRNSKIVCFE